LFSTVNINESIQYVGLIVCLSVCEEARPATILSNKKVPEMSHSMPTNVPLVPGIDNVPRTPRTPHGTLLDRQDPRFYPVVKDGAKPDPQVSVYCLVWWRFLKML